MRLCSDSTHTTLYEEMAIDNCDGQGAMDPYIAKMIIAETSKPSSLLQRNKEDVSPKKTLG